MKCKEYGAFVLIDSLCRDIREQLRLSFPHEFNRIFVIALVRLIYGCGFSKINDYFQMSSASDNYDVSLTKNTVTDFLSYLGNNRQRIMHFMHNYVADSSQLLIDGSNYFYNGEQLDIARKGHNNKEKSQPQITLLYAFNKDGHMPGYYRVLPGNIIDQTSFGNLIQEMSVKDCLFVADKGFYSQKNVNVLRTQGLDYIIPLKHTLKIVDDCLVGRDDDRTYQGFFVYHNRVIWYKKIKKDEKIFIYQYLDVERKTQLEKQYMRNIVEEKEGYTIDEFQRKRKNMGTFYFLSDLDQDCQEIYLTYKGRWEIETMFDEMKNKVGLGENQSKQSSGSRRLGIYQSYYHDDAL